MNDLTRQKLVLTRQRHVRRTRRPRLHYRLLTLCPPALGHLAAFGLAT